MRIHPTRLSGSNVVACLRRGSRGPAKVATIFLDYPQDFTVKNSAGKIYEGVDIRGDGGCVVAAGSSLKIETTIVQATPFLAREVSLYFHYEWDSWPADGQTAA